MLLIKTAFAPTWSVPGLGKGTDSFYFYFRRRQVKLMSIVRDHFRPLLIFVPLIRDYLLLDHQRDVVIIFLFFSAHLRREPCELYSEPLAFRSVGINQVSCKVSEIIKLFIYLFLTVCNSCVIIVFGKMHLFLL